MVTEIPGVMVELFRGTAVRWNRGHGGGSTTRCVWHDGSAWTRV